MTLIITDTKVLLTMHAVDSAGDLQSLVPLVFASALVVVLLAMLLRLGLPCAAPPLLGVLRPISLGAGVICDSSFR